MKTVEVDEKGGRIFQMRQRNIINHLLNRLPPLIAQIEYDPQAITTLDSFLSHLSGIFDVTLNFPNPPFDELCRLLKATNKYLNLRGFIQQQVNWGQALLQYFLDHPDVGVSMDVTVLVIIASGFERLGQVDDAIDLYETIISWFEDDPTNPHLGAIYYNLALAYQKQEEFASAIEVCELAIRLDEKYADKRAIAINRMLLADLHFSLGDIRAGFGQMKQAIITLETLNNPTLLALYTGKLALFMTKYADYEKAIALFESAIRQWELVGDTEQLGLVKFNYANALYEMGNRADAYRHAYESLRVFEAMNSTHLATVRQALAVWDDENPHSTT